MRPSPPLPESPRPTHPSLARRACASQGRSDEPPLRLIADAARSPCPERAGFVGLFSKFCIAQFTAIVAGFISYPFDTVRRRLQMQSEKPKEQWLYSGTVDCAVKIVKEEGVSAMFKGFAANVLRTLGGALVLVGYDEIKAMLAA